jgi:succinate-semialdehyde dehydrogenase/glutarate-semialdehyde dehydrogenase
MTREYQANLALYIDGNWRAGEGRNVHQVLNPATGAILAELPLATAADLDEALAAPRCCTRRPL